MIKCVGNVRLQGLIGLMLLFTQGIFAQNGTIQGTIKDEAGQVLPGATVQVLNLKNATSADNSGNYTLAVPPGKHTFIISFAGNSTLRKELTIVANSVAKQDFVLKSAGDLVDITVIGTRNVSRTRVETPVP